MPIPQSELSDKLVVPAYRQFCRDNGIVLEGGDMKLHVEAMEFFDKLKPHYSYFQGHVVNFHVWSWDFDFLHTEIPIQEFLAQAAQDQERLKRFETWCAIIADIFVFFLMLIGTQIFHLWPDEGFHVPALFLLIIFTAIGCCAWRWFFVIQPRKRRARNREETESQLMQFRQRLADIRLAAEIKKVGLAEAALPRLADALTEHIMAREAEEPGDKEHRRYILADINNLLLTCGPGAEVEQSMLSDANWLRSHLDASLALPAQVLAKELPNRLTEWLQAEPPHNHPVRQEWAELGRFLLDKARMNSDSSE